MDVATRYDPHEGQSKIHLSRDRRFRIVCCGRRWGKTLCLAAELFDRAGTERPGDYGWIAPTYFIAERGVEALRQIAGSFLTIAGRNPIRAELTTRIGTSRILFLSADNPESILGLAFRGIVVDEAARIPANVWNYTIRPTIAQTMGWATLISTPNGAITYNAPGGYHDDCVIALALANSGRFEHKWVGEARVFGVRRGEAILRVGRMRLDG